MGNFNSKPSVALLEAVQLNNIEKAKKLILEGIEWPADYQGNSLLHIAAWNANLEMLALLLKYGANAALRNNDGKTAIELAADSDEWSCVELLLNTENSKNVTSCYPDILLKAVKANQLSIVSTLLKAGVQSNRFNEDTGDTSLHIAAKKNNLKMIALLLHHNADMTLKNFNGLTPIQVAVNKRACECVRTFASNKSDENDAGCYGFALLRAVENNDSNLVITLLNAGATSNWSTSDNCDYPLHIAAKNGNVRIISSLLQYGAHFMKKNDAGKTAIDVAADCKAWECVKVFAEYKPEKKTSKYYDYALIQAVIKERLDVVSTLLNAGATMTVNDTTNGNSPIHYAVIKYNEAIAALLIKESDNIDITNHNDDTPLHLAASNRDIKMIRLLLKHGSNPNVQNCDGKTPAQLAEDNSFTIGKEVILSSGKKKTKSYQELSLWNKPNLISKTDDGEDVVSHIKPSSL